MSFTPTILGPGPVYTERVIIEHHFSDRKWRRPKKYKPQYRKQKMLALRRVLREYPYEKVLHYLDKQMDSSATIFTLFRVNGYDYHTDDVKRVMLRVNSHAKRLLALRYYW